MKIFLPEKCNLFWLLANDSKMEVVRKFESMTSFQFNGFHLKIFAKEIKTNWQADSIKVL